MPTSFTIDGRTFGDGLPPFVVAEMSGNHNGSLERALDIVDAVAATGAHALKLQTYRADTITIDADGPAFRISDDHGLWGGRNLFQLYEEAHTPWEWHAPLFERARQHGLIPFSSPFDPTAIDLLEDLGCQIYKVASAEIVDLPLIRMMASTGKPLIMSTGMATLAEIDSAVRAARSAGASELALLACTSSYPARPEDARLRSIPALRAAFDLPIGLSDHTEGIGVAVAAVALGACIVEKHVTLDREDGGVDSAFSLDPVELGSLCRASDAAARAVTDPIFGPLESEAPVHRLRRSLWVVSDVEAGDQVTAANVRSIRPSGGLPPAALSDVLGRTFRQCAQAGTPLSWDLL
jgi:pseudaminic acid synthase